MNSSLSLLPLIVAFVCFRFCSTCPNVCSCKWKHGKQTAECDGKGLSVIPADLNSETQVIDISRNNLNEISSKAFQKKGLVNLQKIYVIECGITHIATDAFFQLSNLVELDLSHNNLQTVPSNALSLVSSLRRLQIAHNPITAIESGAFLSLSHLTYLDLSNCQIKHVQPGALNGLKKLDVIELNGNKIKTLSIGVFQSVSYLFGLHLDNNPWHCDCKIREIRTWMMDHNIPLSVPPQCESPDYVKGISWDILSLDDFACAPKILNVPKGIKVISGHNASIHCQVHSIPKSSLYWEIAAKSFKNFSLSTDLKMKYNVEQEEAHSHQTTILTIYNAVESDNDVYTCVAENKAGISSVNFTLTVVCPKDLRGSWNNTQISLLLSGIMFVILLSAGIICLLVYRPVSLTFGSKINRKNALQNMKNKDPVEMNKISEDKSDKDLKVSGKQSRQETGSSGYAPEQLTPDLVSKIPDVSKGPSLSLSTLSCNHLDSDNPSLYNGYGPALVHWPYSKTQTLRYDDPSPVRSNVCSEIYLNPCYSKGDDPYNYVLQSTCVDRIPNCDRYIPQNDRVRTLREVYEYDPNKDLSPTQDDGYRRNQLVVANATGHYALHPKNNFSPDEGYAEEGLEGTEV